MTAWIRRMAAVFHGDLLSALRTIKQEGSETTWPNAPHPLNRKPLNYVSIQLNSTRSPRSSFIHVFPFLFLMFCKYHNKQTIWDEHIQMVGFTFFPREVSDRKRMDWANRQFVLQSGQCYNHCSMHPSEWSGEELHVRTGGRWQRWM